MNLSYDEYDACLESLNGMGLCSDILYVNEECTMPAICPFKGNENNVCTYLCPMLTQDTGYDEWIFHCRMTDYHRNLYIKSITPDESDDEEE